jgi:hypothetical protein
MMKKIIACGAAAGGDWMFPPGDGAFTCSLLLGLLELGRLRRPWFLQFRI